MKFLGERLVFGAALIVAGVFWLLDEAGIFHIEGSYIAPIVLIAIGVLLVIASKRRGTRTGLIVVGAILTAVLAGNSSEHRAAMDVPRRGGDNVERPLVASDIHPYRLGAGNLTIDLTHLELQRRTYSINARVAAGTIRVYVPAGVPLRVEARSGGGTIRAVGNRRSGIGVRLETEMAAYGNHKPRIDLHLRAGVGSIYVTREASVAA